MIKWLIKMGVYIGWVYKLFWYIIWNLIMYAYLYPFPMCMMIHESMQKLNLPHWSRVKKGSSIIAHLTHETGVAVIAFAWENLESMLPSYKKCCYSYHERLAVWHISCVFMTPWEREGCEIA